MKPNVILLIAMIFLLGLPSMAQEGSPGTAFLQEKSTSPESVTILWSSNDPDVFYNCIMPYYNYSCEKHCWKEMNLLMWGPSVRLLAENQDLQIDLSELISRGLNVKASKYSMDKFKVTEKMSRLGVEALYIEEDITRELKKGMANLIAF